MIIIGGGPAGLSAGLWCAELGLSTRLLEKEPQYGGQLLRIHNPITNYPGIRSISGIELRDRFEQNGKSDALTKHLQVNVESIDVENLTVLTDNGERFYSRAIIIATGIRPRKLSVPGEKEFQGKGIMESGSGEKQSAFGKTVAIVGGGDAAFENALILSEFAEKIYVIHRRSEFLARQGFVESVKLKPNIEVIPEMTIREIQGSEEVDAIEIENPVTSVRKLLVDKVLIRIGVVPNTEFLKGSLDLDPNGYIVVNARCETSATGVFAVGDVANPLAPTIASATGTGATAAKAILFLLKSYRR